MLFPAHYAKVVKCGGMTCDVTVVINSGGGFQVFFNPLSKCPSYGTQGQFKSGKTIKDELVAPKGKDHIAKKSAIIYRFKCDRWNVMRST